MISPHIDDWFGPKKILFILALVLVMLWVTSAHAAPRMGSREDCMMAADIALTAAALENNGAPKNLADGVMADIYHTNSDKGRELISMIRQAAAQYISTKSGTPGNFAVLVGSTCLKTGGDMDSILGTAL